jgi:hypothetical protein
LIQRNAPWTRREDACVAEISTPNRKVAALPGIVKVERAP